jgi:uncharacterized membrane protein
MSKSRLEAFSDGVIAILITIMVLELKVPHEGDLAALGALLPVFASYVVSFTFVGIYWNNHHHLVHAAKGVSPGMMWANLHLLFWLSLVPFVTGWLGEHHTAAWPTALYGVVMILSAVAYTILQLTIVGQHAPDSELARAVGADVKGKLSLSIYVVATGLAFVRPWLSDLLFVLVALMWLIPDRRVVHAA